jgi:hypothetical protein
MQEHQGLALTAAAQMKPAAANVDFHMLQRLPPVRFRPPRSLQRFRHQLSGSLSFSEDLVMPDIDVTNRVMLDGFSAAEQRSLKLMLHRMRRNLAAAAKPAAAVKRRATAQSSRPC